MKFKRALIFLGLNLLFALFTQQKVNAQSVYIKFTSDSTGTKSWCDIYLTGSKIPYKQSAMIPSNNFTFLKCADTLTKYEIFLDINNEKLKSFSKLPGYYHCGDSILVNLEKRNAIIINQKKE